MLKDTEEDESKKEDLSAGTKLESLGTDALTCSVEVQREMTRLRAITKQEERYDSGLLDDKQSILAPHALIQRKWIQRCESSHWCSAVRYHGRNLV